MNRELIIQYRPPGFPTSEPALSRLERMEINPVFNREFHRLAHRDRIPPIVAARAAVPPVARIYRPDRRTATVPGAPSARLFSRVATTAAAGTTPFSCAMRARVRANPYC